MARCPCPRRGLNTCGGWAGLPLTAGECKRTLRQNLCCSSFKLLGLLRAGAEESCPSQYHGVMCLQHAVPTMVRRTHGQMNFMLLHMAVCTVCGLNVGSVGSCDDGRCLAAMPRRTALPQQCTAACTGPCTLSLICQVRFEHEHMSAPSMVVIIQQSGLLTAVV